MDSSTNRPSLWGDQRYYALSKFLKNKFGGKVHKVPLDAGLTCPNRDGRLSYDGCIFCSGRGSGDFAGSPHQSIKDQIAEGITSIQSKHSIHQFIAYFQAFTNTYASVDQLKELYEQALGVDEVVGIAIATRPDCLNGEVLNLLDEMSRKTYLWVELGLQTVHDKTAELINRHYPLKCFEDALDSLNQLRIDVVCHTILGLPRETHEMMVETAEYLSRKHISGIKLQLLHVLKDTPLARMYETGEFQLLSREDYVQTAADCLEVLSPEIVIHRLTGDGPKDTLIGPKWSHDKIGVLQDIDRELRWRRSWQGKRFRNLNERG